MTPSAVAEIIARLLDGEYDDESEVLIGAYTVGADVRISLANHGLSAPCVFTLRIESSAG